MQVEKRESMHYISKRYKEGTGKLSSFNTASGQKQLYKISKI